MASPNLTHISASLTGYTWRTARRTDAHAIYQLYAAADLADHTWWAGTLEEVHNDFDSPRSDPQRGTLVAVAPDGSLAAVGWIFINPEGSQELRAFLWGQVHPKHRMRGLGDRLLHWQEQRAARLLADFADGRPRKLRAVALSTQEDRNRLLQRHGFEAVRNFYRMRRDLRLPLPEKPLPPGVRIVRWSPELDEAARQASNEAFQDHWGSEPSTAEDWKLHFAASREFRPDITALALAGDRVVGVCMCTVRAEDNARQGINEGWVNILAVVRAWRGKGLASALLMTSMEGFRAAGLETVGLGVDAENLTGALRLYESMGFRAVQRTITYFKDASEA